MTRVGSYDAAKTGLLPLKGIITDHKRKEFFGNTYKYTIIRRVTANDSKSILRQAEDGFSNNDYEGIIAMFSNNATPRTQRKIIIIKNKN